MKTNLNKCIKAYDSTQKYSFDNNIILNWYAHRIINKYSPELKVLDLGLGHGIVAKIFSNHFHDYTVLDGSSEIIEKFKKENKNFKGNIQEVFFEDFKTNEHYDLIVMGFILEHVENPLIILNKYKKYLKTNGKIIITVPNAESMNRRIGHLSNLLKNIYELSSNDLLLGHKRYFTISSIEDLIKNASLKNNLVEGIYLKPLTTSQILSLNLDKSIIKAFCELGISYPELSTAILVETEALWKLKY